MLLSDRWFLRINTYKTFTHKDLFHDDAQAKLNSVLCYLFFCPLFLLGDICLHQDDSIYVSSLAAHALLCNSHQGLHPCFRVWINITTAGKLILQYKKTQFLHTQVIQGSFHIWIFVCTNKKSIFKLRNFALLFLQEIAEKRLCQEKMAIMTKEVRTGQTSMAVAWNRPFQHKCPSKCVTRAQTSQIQKSSLSHRPPQMATQHR